jgi:uncharacterized protein YbaP (TraB family)
MRRALALAALITLSCAGTGTFTEPLPACEPGSPGVPLAFGVHAPDGQVAFLQGSVHFAREAEATLDPRANEALKQAQVLVGELDMQALTAEAMAKILVEKGRLPDGQTLQSVLSPDTWSLLVERAEEVGAPLDAFQPLEPWVVALNLLGLSLVQAGYSSEEGVEQQVFAGERPAQTRGLETLDDQISLFDSLTLPEQEYMLRGALKPSAQNAAELEALFAAWRCGDAAELETLLAGMIAADPTLAPFYEVTIFRRNENMALGVQQVLGEVDRAFIVVGALHLVGARGIPALLEQAGFRVEQLRSQP